MPFINIKMIKIGQAVIELSTRKLLQIELEMCWRNWNLFPFFQWTNWKNLQSNKKWGNIYWFQSSRKLEPNYMIIGLLKSGFKGVWTDQIQGLFKDFQGPFSSFSRTFSQLNFSCYFEKSSKNKKKIKKFLIFFFLNFKFLGGTFFMPKYILDPSVPKFL